MKPGLIVKGRRYYSPKFDEYVVAVKRHREYITFRRASGETVLLKASSVFYLSVEDWNLCDTLATEAKMTWFWPGFDDETQTEYNIEWINGRERRKSFRAAVRDLSEGLIDQNFLMMPNPQESNARFRKIVRGLGICDPGDYI